MTIHLQNITKKYGSDLALQEVDLELTKGKIYGLLGPNGSGKSTLLKLITGLAHPNQGRVTVFNEEVTRKIAHQVAYLTELDMFYDSFTIKQMISFYDSQFPDFNLDKAYVLLHEMNLPIEKKIKNLSKGNRGRFKLVLTLSRDVPVLLLDEPFSGLDALVRDAIVKSLLTHINLEEQIIVIATHEINELESLLDEVFIIYKGKIIEHQNVEEIREHEGVSVLNWYKGILQEKERESIEIYRRT